MFQVCHYLGKLVIMGEVMHKSFTAFVFAGLAMVAPALAASATFDSGDEGFVLTGGALSSPTAGGNPGGYLDLDDNLAGLWN